MTNAMIRKHDLHSLRLITRASKQQAAKKRLIKAAKKEQKAVHCQ